ncbi:MAG TPA: VOC family protein [Dehalococcoidia bacterium]|nr:VOC family protein [Dehalococcoidia bacterium]
MIEKVQNVFYRVADLDRSIAFYGDVIGLKLKFRDGSKWAEFDAGNVSLGLELLEGQGTAGAGGGVVVLRGPGLDELLERVRSAGYAQIGEIDQRPYGRIARFADPDGNEVNYLEPKPK